MLYSTDVNKNKRAYISNTKVMCAKSTLVDSGQVFVVLFTRKVVTCSVVYCKRHAFDNENEILLQSRNAYVCIYL